VMLRNWLTTGMNEECTAPSTVSSVRFRREGLRHRGGGPPSPASCVGSVLLTGVLDYPHEESETEKTHRGAIDTCWVRKGASPVGGCNPPRWSVCVPELCGDAVAAGRGEPPCISGQTVSHARRNIGSCEGVHARPVF
jgi:hypothetical protein